MFIVECLFTGIECIAGVDGMADHGDLHLRIKTRTHLVDRFHGRYLRGSRISFLKYF